MVAGFPLPQSVYVTYSNQPRFVATAYSQSFNVKDFQERFLWANDHDERHTRYSEGWLFFIAHTGVYLTYLNQPRFVAIGYRSVVQLEGLRERF